MFNPRKEMDIATLKNTFTLGWRWSGGRGIFRVGAYSTKQLLPLQGLLSGDIRSIQCSKTDRIYGNFWRVELSHSVEIFRSVGRFIFLLAIKIYFVCSPEPHIKWVPYRHGRKHSLVVERVESLRTLRVAMNVLIISTGKPSKGVNQPLDTIMS